MQKQHDLKKAVAMVDGVPASILYFYIREKNDVNGNARFRVYVIDPGAPAVYETIFKCYESQLSERVKRFMEG
jgi:hypothetical protein